MAAAGWLRVRIASERVLLGPRLLHTEASFCMLSLFSILLTRPVLPRHSRTHSLTLHYSHPQTRARLEAERVRGLAAEAAALGIGPANARKSTFTPAAPFPPFEARQAAAAAVKQRPFEERLAVYQSKTLDI